LIFVAPQDHLRSVDERRLREMNAQADAWLARQSADAVRQPRSFSPVHQDRLDAELDLLLAEVDAAMDDVSEDEVTTLVDEAVKAVRRNI
jgi:hypothetical protein